jgi:hypothetical protein
VNTGVATAGFHVALERALLGLVEDVARRGHEDDDVVLGEVGVGELRRVLGRVDREAVLRAERLDRRDPLRDRVVTELDRLGEHEDLFQGPRRLRGTRAERTDKYRSEQTNDRSASKTHATSPR